MTGKSEVDGKLGVYTAILHDRPLPEALRAIAELGLGGAEINAGGFLPSPHLPIDEVLGSDTARDEYLGVFEAAGVSLNGLNVNGNPLHPDGSVRERQSRDVRRAVEVAGRLGVRRVVAMSGLPEAHPGGRAASWTVAPWDSAYLDALDHQWDQVAVPFWREIDASAAEHDVQVCIEMHPHNLVFNPATLERLVQRTGAGNIGAELDPSHLFWQGIDPIAAVEHLGGLVRHAAAKDTRINAANMRVHGVLDDRFRRVPSSAATSLAGASALNSWPEDPSWEFVAVGRGHDEDFWSRFLRALWRVDPGMAVNIEHEDLEFGPLEGLQVAAQVLRSAAAQAE